MRADMGELEMTTSSAGPRPTERAFETVVLHVGGQFRASEKAVVEAALGRHPGVVLVEANPVAQIATVRYDPAVTSVQELRRAVERSGFECAGCNTPGCLCDPLHEPGEPEHGHDAAAVARAHDPAGHGEGGHAGHSMDQMAREMRNRFLLALVLRWRSLPGRASVRASSGTIWRPRSGWIATSGSCC
jgi:copper chaperone CopZ